MNTALDKISHKAHRAAASVIIDKVLAMVDKDREKGFLERKGSRRKDKRNEEQ